TSCSSWAPMRGARASSPPAPVTTVSPSRSTPSGSASRPRSSCPSTRRSSKSRRRDATAPRRSCMESTTTTPTSVPGGWALRVDAGATIADGIAVRQVGELTLALARQWVDRVVTVDEEELANAVLLLLEIEKAVVEGAGAAPLAALLNRGLDLEGRRVALVLSGGNIDVTTLARIIERGLVKDGRLVRLGVLLRDVPGALARLTAVIADERANILPILHDRAFSPHAAIGQTKVELTLE